MKLIFQKGLNGNKIPEKVTQEWIDTLSDCSIVNPFTMESERVHVHDPIWEPFKYSSIEFEIELVKTARAVHMAKNNMKFEIMNDLEDYGKMPGYFISECIASQYKVVHAGQLADIVHQDFPSQFMDDLLRFFWKSAVKIDQDLFSKVHYSKFTDGIVMLERIVADIIHEVSPTAFAHKYHFWVARPEEVIGAWARGEVKFSPLTEDALKHYVNKDEVKSDQRKFTMYSEGCPNHPSFPAMHSSLAAMALFFPVIFNLTDAQEVECKKMATNIAYGRTFAGVHYPMDNQYGLELGERVLESLLPKMLEHYGGISENISKKISLKRTKWIAK